MGKILSGNEIRFGFIKFFEERGHKFVPSASLVPGGDQTLLFTNAGMVQFKDVFLGTDKREYSRAVNSQKCMRVAGKHNDLDDVGRDDSHHTFFEMLGNWSFGDYYKKEAISWAWELLTDVWQLEKSKIWVTCFKDEKGEIETDQEAVANWKKQPGLEPKHILFFGRKDNFWEMAETGPCGPSSEIHYDRGTNFCDKQDDPTHTCTVNGDCTRFLELWNLVFIQYNRLDQDNLEPLPAKHVDTGMGFERIVSILQEVDSNYRTDILFPIIEEVRKLTGDTEKHREENFTPYRVIADHSRAATFLISDGVVPGNIGRNYICRMIIRRAARFGTKIGLNEPFLGRIAKSVIDIYGKAYPELENNRKAIVDSITREEERFLLTIQNGLAYLENEISRINTDGGKVLSGEIAFDLYATHGLPLEITKDVLLENDLQVNEEEYFHALESHKVNSGAGKEFGPLGGENAEKYAEIKVKLVNEGVLAADGVVYDPYNLLSFNTKISALLKDGVMIRSAKSGDEIEIIIPKTGFYIESGGQVSDQGMIQSLDEKSMVEIIDIQKPAADLIVHMGKVIKGEIVAGEEVLVSIDQKRRLDTMRNHTATHLLQAELRKILGNHVRQAGSLVAPDKLRFDFTHPKSLSPNKLQQIEDAINDAIYDNYILKTDNKPLETATQEGAMALFGEKYGEVVRTVEIKGANVASYELCGGTHVSETAEIGIFAITSEGSAAAGIRRIEAITGREAYSYLSKRARMFAEIATELETNVDNTYNAVKKIKVLISEQDQEIEKLKLSEAINLYKRANENTLEINNIPVMPMIFKGMNMVILRSISDVFRDDFSSGILVAANLKNNKEVQLIAAVTDDLVEKGLNAGNIIKLIAQEHGGSGGGRPQLAQAGIKAVEDPESIFKNLENYIS
jgi:alanyl-tRNA synthetase